MVKKQVLKDIQIVIIQNNIQIKNEKKIVKYNKFLSYESDILKMEEVSLDGIAKKIKTPLYCYSVSQIKYNFDELKNSFSNCKPLICYAVKANFNKNIIRILGQLEI